MNARRPRTVLAAAIGLMVVVLALLAVALVRADAGDRHDAERGFSDRADVSAALTESLFTSSAGQSAAENAKLFGSETIDPARLRALMRRGRLAYAMVVDESGAVLGRTDATPDSAVAGLDAPHAMLEAVLAGTKPVYLSDVISGNPDVLQYAVGFETAHGRRVLVQGFPTKALSGFLGGYLARIPGAAKTSAYILDSRGRVVATPVKTQATGEIAAEPGLLGALDGGGGEGKFDAKGSERSFASTPIANSTWRVVLSTPTSALYAGISTLLHWLTIVGLALAGIIALIAIGRASTARAALHDANELLAGTNDDLERTNLELQRSNGELEQFASIASHDLQEPLRKVQTFGDQLEQRFGDQMPEEAVDYLRRMRRSAGRMSTLIEDLLLFSRVTTHARPPERVDLSEVARDVLSDLEVAVSDVHGSVVIGELPVIDADPMQMRQLMQNLIANAIKFHRPGISPQVALTAAHAPAGSAAFSVTDNGIGFDPQYGERIFRVFERLHARDVFAGTGIGLALCRKIVGRHGGKIVAEGRPDDGCTFTVTVPARSSRGGSPPPAAPGPCDEARELSHV